MKSKIDVVAALIKKGDKILLCQRNKDDRYGNLWEFPGGKIEPNESAKQAIEREIEEELGLKVEAKGLVDEFSDEDPGLIIKVFLYSCEIKQGKPSALDCQNWGFFTLKEAKNLDLAPVDKKILIGLI